MDSDNDNNKNVNNNNEGDGETQTQARSSSPGSEEPRGSEPSPAAGGGVPAGGGGGGGETSHSPTGGRSSSRKLSSRGRSASLYMKSPSSTRFSRHSVGSMSSRTFTSKEETSPPALPVSARRSSTGVVPSKSSLRSASSGVGASSRTSTGFIATLEEEDSFSNFADIAKRATTSLQEIAGLPSQPSLPPSETSAAEYFAKRDQFSGVDQSVNFMDHRAANYEVDEDEDNPNDSKSGGFLPQSIFQQHKPKEFQRSNPSGPSKHSSHTSTSLRDVFLSTRNLRDGSTRGMSVRKSFDNKEKKSLETFAEGDESVVKDKGRYYGGGAFGGDDKRIDKEIFLSSRMLFLLFLLIVILTVLMLTPDLDSLDVLRPSSSSTTSTATTTNTKNNNQNAESRLTEIKSHLNNLGMYRVNNENSFAYRAMEWISKEDEAQLTVDDPHFMERFVMAVIYYAFGEGENWRARRHWLSGFSLCHWYGITCSDEGNVVVLDLSNNGLGPGRIPTELAALTKLSALDLSHNQLTGSIPTKLYSMSGLREWQLHHNALTGTIHENLGQMQGLRIVLLGNNRLEGSLPRTLSNLVHLVRLSLANNTLDGSIPHGRLASLKHIEYLHLEDNSFHGKLPTSVALPTLRELWLGGNQLSGSLPVELGSMQQIESIRLNGNLLGGPIPDVFGNLSELEELHLQENKLSLQLPESLDGLVHLESLLLGNNDFTGTIPNWDYLIGLKTLTLNDCNIGGTIPATLGNCALLERLELNGNALTGTIPTELGQLESLKVCRLNENSLQGHVPAELSQLLHLQTLALELNDLTGEVPRSICNNQLEGDLSHITVDCGDGEVECPCCDECY